MKKTELEKLQQKQNSIKEIAIYNRNAIYNLRPKYKAINKIFKRSPELRRTLLLIHAFIIKNGCVCDDGEPYIYLTTKKLTRLRGKSQKYLSISNKYINYLTAAGFISKVKQTIDYDTMTHELNRTNRELISKFAADDLKRIHFKPKNIFMVEKYTKTILERIEHNIAELEANNIRPTTISNDKLNHKQQHDKSRHTYYNNTSGLEEKLKNREKLFCHIDRLIEKNGYTVKNEALYRVRDIGGRKKAEETLKFFMDDFKQKYSYKRPSKAEREKFNLRDNKFIITRKDI